MRNESTQTTELRFITTAQAGQLLSCTDRHVRDLIAAGKLQAIKLGKRALRVELSALERFAVQAMA